MLNVCEIFKSIQGESTHAGEICSFVRLAGCNLRCSYCDTAYAWAPGRDLSIEEICNEISAHRCRLAEITGGEPLLQTQTPDLCRTLVDLGHTVLVETNGTLDISLLPQGVSRIMDVKCPGSGMADRFIESNIERLAGADECKFVISDRTDFLWAIAFVNNHALDRRCTVIFSPNAVRCKPKDLAQWILEADRNIRMGLQLHKVIWGADARGV